MEQPTYYVVGLRPVKFVPTPQGGLAVLKMNWETGAFEYGNEYLDKVMYGKDDVEAVSEDQFIQHVESQRARRLKGEGTLYSLYDLINGMEDVAEEQGRPLTSEEKATIAELRRRTYALFQAAHPDPG